MNGDLRLVNRQKSRAVDLRMMRKAVRTLLETLLGLDDFDLTICLVGEKKMARLNEAILGHQGSTDVITLDYENLRGSSGMSGELFVCVDEAILQARRYRASWQEELVRYIVHGSLHLLGHDDHAAAKRKKMKSEESRLVRKLAASFDLRKLQRKIKLRA